MKKMKCLLILGIILSNLFGPSVRSETNHDPVLLSANGFTVTYQDLQQILMLLSDTERAQILAGSESLKKQLRLIYQGKRLAAEAERLGLDQAPLTQARLTVQRRLILSEALRDSVRTQIETPNFATLAREYYVAHPNEFQLPTQFKAMHILKKVHCDCEQEPQLRKMEQLLAQLQAGADFATLARVESEDPGSAANGGSLDQWVSREQLVAPFADALAKLEVGQLSSVVKTQYGFHIIKKLDERSARQQGFEEVQKDIEQRLRQTYVKDQLQQRSVAYQAGADAKFDEAALQSILQNH